MRDDRPVGLAVAIRKFSAPLALWLLPHFSAQQLARSILAIEAGSRTCGYTTKGFGTLYQDAGTRRRDGGAGCRHREVPMFRKGGSGPVGT
jgi:hypothetical protein